MGGEEEPKPVRKITEAEDASLAAGEAETLPDPRVGDQLIEATNIDTGSGVYIGGSVNTGGGDFIGRDKIVYGETLNLHEVFLDLDLLVEALPAGPKKSMAKTAIDGLKTEAQKGDQADSSHVQKWFDYLASIAPDIFDVAVTTFLNPIQGLSKVFRKIAKKAQED